MVEPVRPGRIGAPALVPRDGGRTADGRFSIDEGGGPPTQSARLSSTASIGLEGMLALQSVNEADERDRAARKRGFAMIAGLASLQRAMLSGADAASVLRTLDEISKDGVAVDDPRLEAILRAVVLRSRVELARRQKRK
jgi:hypothetical protein